MCKKDNTHLIKMTALVHSAAWKFNNIIYYLLLYFITFLLGIIGMPYTIMRPLTFLRGAKFEFRKKNFISS